ncbi:MAG: amidohydrolase family protein [Clostridia bacterium]|nr:amidohydrolase family protein [Clostridia bacterium]
MKKLFKNGKVLDIIAKQVKEADILVEDGMIAAVGKDLDVPKNIKTVDLKGMTVLPGLFNCHVHITSEPDPRKDKPKSDAALTIQAMNNLALHLSSGVTYIRDVGSANFIDIELRDAVASGQIQGPDMQVSGRCICMTGGHGWATGRQADGPDECRKAAREMLRAGADWIKVMATGGVMTKGVEPGAEQLTTAEMAAIVEEALKKGALTCTHAQGNTGIKNALAAGIDCIEHGIYLDDEAIDTMLKQGSWLVPTLCAPHFILKYGIAGGVPEYAVRKTEIVHDHHFASFQKAYKAGVKCACGTDAGTPYNPHNGTPNELVLMVKSGLTPMEAIETATINSARLMGVEKSLGSIEVGKKAHFAIFRKDPTEDIDNITVCQMTVKNGEIVYKK